MYRWVRERHMIGIRGRNFLEAPWEASYCSVV